MRLRDLKKWSDTSGYDRTIFRLAVISSMDDNEFSSSRTMLLPPLLRIWISSVPSILVHPFSDWAAAMLSTVNPLQILSHLSFSHFLHVFRQLVSVSLSSQLFVSAKYPFGHSIAQIPSSRGTNGNGMSFFFTWIGTGMFRHASLVMQLLELYCWGRKGDNEKERNNVSVSLRYTKTHQLIDPN